MIPDKHEIVNESLNHKDLNHHVADDNMIFIGVKRTNMNIRLEKEFLGNGNCKGWTVYCFNSKEPNHLKLKENIVDIATLSYLFSFFSRGYLK